MFEYFFLWVKTTNFKLLRLVFFTNKETRTGLRVLASEAQTVLESLSSGKSDPDSVNPELWCSPGKGSSSLPHFTGLVLVPLESSDEGGRIFLVLGLPAADVVDLVGRRGPDFLQEDHQEEEDGDDERHADDHAQLLHCHQRLVGQLGTAAHAARQDEAAAAARAFAHQGGVDGVTHLPLTTLVHVTHGAAGGCSARMKPGKGFGSFNERQ